jgi:hypothetical protein
MGQYCDIELGNVVTTENGQAYSIKILVRDSVTNSAVRNFEAELRNLVKTVPFPQEVHILQVAVARAKGSKKGVLPEVFLSRTLDIVRLEVPVLIERVQRV